MLNRQRWLVVHAGTIQSFTEPSSLSIKTQKIAAYLNIFSYRMGPFDLLWPQAINLQSLSTIKIKQPVVHELEIANTWTIAKNQLGFKSQSPSGPRGYFWKWILL